MLKTATDDELSDLYSAGSHPGATAGEQDAARMAMAEMRRRDRNATSARRRAQADAAWLEAVEAHFIGAEAECCGNLTARGSWITDPNPTLYRIPDVQFWGTTDARGKAGTPGQASEEMKNYCREHPRPTRAEFMRAEFRPQREEREEVEAMDQESGGRAESAPGEAGTAQESPAGPGAGEDMPPAGSEDSGDAERRARILARGERRALLKARRAPAALPPGLTRKPTAAVAVPGSHLPPALRREAGYQVGDGAVLWDLVRTFLAHYVAFRGEAELDLVTAWTIAATARDRDDTGMGQLIWRAFPRLLVTSRKRGAGKSTVLDLILILTLSRRGKMPKVTPAKLAEVLGKYFEVAAIDEAKAIFGAGKAHMELQGCLLAGYTKRASYEVAGKSYSLFGAVAYAAKEDLVTETNSGPDGGTIGDLIDRSLTVLQPPPSRPMPEVGERAEDDGERLGEALVTWTNDKRDELRAAAMQIADEDQAHANGLYEAGEATGSPRMYQISRPLRAVARIAGPEAEEAVNRALAELTGGAASAKATADINELVTLSRAWRAAPDEDESGQIVMDGTDDDEWED